MPPPFVDRRINIGPGEPVLVSPRTFIPLPPPLAVGAAGVEFMLLPLSVISRKRIHPG
jgi:hypothetical protein